MVHNVAIIFAGGTGQRMNTRTKPKQFLELHGKPIIIHTIEQFEKHPSVDGIVVVCLESWIDELLRLLKVFSITKVDDVVSGGRTGQESIMHGVMRASELYPEETIVLIHDGVRPLVDEDTISSCIETASHFGNAIAVVPATETIVQQKNGIITEIKDRSSCYMARAPQCFRLDDIKEAHAKALQEGFLDAVDSASLMRHFGWTLHAVEGNVENIKITTPSDFYTFRAITDARESSQIFGY